MKKFIPKNREQCILGDSLYAVKLKCCPIAGEPVNAILHLYSLRVIESW